MFQREHQPQNRMSIKTCSCRFRATTVRAAKHPIQKRGLHKFGLPCAHSMLTQQLPILLDDNNVPATVMLNGINPDFSPSPIVHVHDKVSKLNSELNYNETITKLTYIASLHKFPPIREAITQLFQFVDEILQSGPLHGLPGRPKTSPSRLIKSGRRKTKRLYCCSNCGKSGHNSRTCHRPQFYERDLHKHHAEHHTTEELQAFDEEDEEFYDFTSEHLQLDDQDKFLQKEKEKQAIWEQNEEEDPVGQQQATETRDRDLELFYSRFPCLREFDVWFHETGHQEDPANWNGMIESCLVPLLSDPNNVEKLTPSEGLALLYRVAFMSEITEEWLVLGMNFYQENKVRLWDQDDLLI